MGSRADGQAGEPQRASSRPPPQASRGPSAHNGHMVYDPSATNSVQATGWCYHHVTASAQGTVPATEAASCGLLGQGGRAGRLPPEASLDKPPPRDGCFQGATQTGL